MRGLEIIHFSLNLTKLQTWQVKASSIKIVIKKGNLSQILGKILGWKKNPESEFPKVDSFRKYRGFRFF